MRISRHTLVASAVAAVGISAVPGSALAGPDGITYEVEVIASYGDQFVECYRFDEEGNLTADGIPDPLVYAHDELGEDRNKWQATSVAGASFGIAIHGRTIRLLGERISGNAISDSGATFTLRGRENPDCSAMSMLESSDLNPYER